MKIIAGKYKNKTILNYPDDSIRATMSRAKEGLFNIINYHIEDKTFLDLFAGSGNIGIEAMSRGASNVTFVDKDSDSIKLIKKNLKSIDEQYEVIFSDSKSYVLNCNTKYDYIFLDPPYNLDIEEIKNICDNCYSLLNDNGQLIIELDKEYEYEIDNLEKLKTRKYGKTYFTMYEKVVR